MSLESITAIKKKIHNSVYLIFAQKKRTNKSILVRFFSLKKSIEAEVYKRIPLLQFYRH